MTKLRESEAFFNPPSAEVRAPGNVRPATRIGFKRLTEGAVIPTKAHASDSGFDLVASEDVIIAPGETVVVPTGIAVDLPAGYEAQVRPRSGVTAKTKLRVQFGTVDQSYKGEIGVICDNIAGEISDFRVIEYEHLDGTASEVPKYLIEDKWYGDCVEYEKVPYKTYLIRKGDRIAQLVIQRLPKILGVEVSDVGESERGANGFGSSGL